MQATILTKTSELRDTAFKNRKKATDFEGGKIKQTFLTPSFQNTRTHARKRKWEEKRAGNVELV